MSTDRLPDLTDPDDDSPSVYGTGVGKHAGPVLIRTWDSYPGQLPYTGRRRDETPIIR